MLFKGLSRAILSVDVVCLPFFGELPQTNAMCIYLVKFDNPYFSLLFVKFVYNVICVKGQLFSSEFSSGHLVSASSCAFIKPYIVGVQCTGIFPAQSFPRRLVSTGTRGQVI